MDQATAGLVGALIGAGGALAAQVTASAFAQRSENKRFKWEQDQAERRDALDRTSRFAETKRELFGAYLALHREFLAEVLVDYYDGKGSAEALSEYYHEEVRRTAWKYDEEVGLLAPVLQRPCQSVLVTSGRALLNAMDRALERIDGDAYMMNRDAYLSDTRAYREALSACQAAMSLHLGAAGDDDVSTS